ncbi:MAG: TetR/AcrR family transcriptional regulator [Pseudomonadota bacterium]
MNREKAKNLNRAKICEAAESIIRKEGIKKLTMRRLAEEARVSIATPYNLFGSKNDVLISLMMTAEFDTSQLSSPQANRLALELLLGALDQAQQFFEKDEAFYRAILREIMIAEDTAPSHNGLVQMTAITHAFVIQAIANNELHEETSADDLSHHLATILLSVLGMWASGFFSSAEGIAHVRRSWRAVLMDHCTEKSREIIAAIR